MYQVVIMYGDNEPWWFFEDWQADVTEEYTFNDLTAAEQFYENKWLELSPCFSNLKSRPNYQAAFWNESDERWCEECDDYLQQYTGLALLKDYNAVVEKSSNRLCQTINGEGKLRVCKRKVAN
ncbi:DUF1033 family protein [Enterococcus montenegrensis]|uniref:DUF1033 family protein n=1 Tax=Enterococcus montenegrensis TaxID=3031993 RepID=UPI00249EC525|nr:DUF1033 family protein [Enterococcus montenegrensis]WHA08907.1 DUF1033 family protein [Enterococcus montenegrensis]